MCVREVIGPKGTKAGLRTEHLVLELISVLEARTPWFSAGDDSPLMISLFPPLPGNAER